MPGPWPILLPFRRRIGLRLLVTLGLLLLLFGGLTLSQNILLFGAFRETLVTRDLARLDRDGTLLLCDADPPSWVDSMPSPWRVEPLSPEGRPWRGGSAPLPGFTQAPPGRLVSLSSPWSLQWQGFVRLERTGPCAGLRFTQDTAFAMPGDVLVQTTTLRVLAALLLVVGTWTLAVRPLVRRIQQASHQTRTIVDNSFEGELPSENGDELDDLAASFNAAARAARERLARLEAQDRLIREVMADIAHDLRTPLAALKLAVGRLLAEHPGAEVNRLVRSELDYLDGLVANLGALVRLEGTARPLVRRDVDLGEIIARVHLRFQLLARERSVCVECATPEEGLHVQGDPLALEQALANLVQNAVDFAHENVAIVAWREEARVVVEVRDDGPGLQRTDIPHLSERHYRGASNTGGRKGMGLGLAISAEVARRHGGHLTPSVPEEGGTCMRLTLAAG